ncbi:MAG: DUF1223 domain-containing protein [Pseudomonadota bacterium]
MRAYQNSKIAIVRDYDARLIFAAFFITIVIAGFSMALAPAFAEQPKQEAEKAAKTFAESGSKQVTLIELFSSEGCSSCPPADRQLARLKSHKQLYKSFVPIEFHVDYWNYLGWTDPFSNKQFSSRQRRYAKEWGNGRVYTPGFVIRGQEHRLGTALVTKKGSAKPGNLKVLRDNSNFEIEFTPSEDLASRQLVVNCAVLGNGLKTKVPAGENAGETLKHEFVVLKHKQVRLKKGKSGRYTASIKLKKPDGSQAESFGAAFWVNASGSQVQLQATGAPL